MIDTDKYEGLTIDDWYKMNHHDWKDVVNEYNDLLAEVKRLRDAALTACKVLMKHYEWMSVNDATSEEDDQEILDTVEQLREVIG